MTTYTRVFDNRIIRDVTLAHRVSAVYAAGDVTNLDCDCGKKFRSFAPADDATRRLWKTHAIHVSAQLMQIGNDQ